MCYKQQQELLRGYRTLLRAMAIRYFIYRFRVRKLRCCMMC